MRNRWSNRAKAKDKSINTLVEVVPEGVNALEETQEWEEIEMAVASGAWCNRDRGIRRYDQGSRDATW